SRVDKFAKASAGPSTLSLDFAAFAPFALFAFGTKTGALSKHLSQHSPKHRPRRPIPTHPMHPSARRRRSRTEENPRVRSRVGHEPNCRPREQLPHIHHPPADVASHVVRVVLLHRHRIHHVSGHDAIA